MCPVRLEFRYNGCGKIAIETAFSVTSGATKHDENCNDSVD
jgi:hypothetical protein